MSRENQNNAEMEETVLIKFWTNDVIWQEIMTYLNLTDLKYLSCVNKNMNFKVRSLSRLKSLFGQTFRTFLDSEIKTAKICRAVVEVDGIHDHRLEGFIAESLKDVEYLELQDLKGDEISTKTKTDRLIRIVSGCGKLKSLAFGKKHFFGIDLDAIFVDDGVQTVFRNLKELTIGVDNTIKKDCFGLVLCFGSLREYRNSGSEAERRRQHTFELLENLKMKLSKFSYTDPERYVSFLLPKQVLASSEQTLVELNLEAESTALERLKTMKFPNLTKFSVITYDSDHINAAYISVFEDRTEVLKNNLIPFLQNHKSRLKDFSFSADYCYSLVPLCEVLKTFKEITHLKFKAQPSFTGSPKQVDWSFLQAFSTCRSFKLQTNYVNEDWARFILTLPSTIKSVAFRGFKHKNKFDVTSVVTTSFARFENLTELKMTKCGNFLNDETLQFLCSKLTKLTVFVGEFDDVTDFGISGRRTCGTESGISLKNLKGLKKLGIKVSAFIAHYFDLDQHNKLMITWDGLLRSVEFLDLVELKIQTHPCDAHYDQDDYDSKDGYAYHQLVRQNPSLETIHLAFYTPKHWFLKELPKINSRIKL